MKRCGFIGSYMRRLWCANILNYIFVIWSYLLLPICNYSCSITTDTPPLQCEQSSCFKERNHHPCSDGLSWSQRPISCVLFFLWRPHYPRWRQAPDVIIETGWFAPGRYFLWQAVSVVLVQTSWQDSFIWPLVIFLLTCCIYPLASSCAHTFSSMSARARHICFFFDYAALSFYSLGECQRFHAPGA